MPEYIEREAVQEILERYSVGTWRGIPCYPDEIKSVAKDVNALPPADVVAVVRCKDCRNSMLWRKPTDTVIGECLIRKMHSEDEVFCQVGADDFCSYGERRTDDATD